MAETLILLTFVFGYMAIVAENSINIDKAATALLTGVLCWTFYIFGQENKSEVVHQLTEHLGEVSGILFFLLGAMTVVELIDAHDGFQVITDRITTKNARKLLIIVAILTFFLSAILDNLTTTIVMVSLLRKLVADREKRVLFAGMVVIAANAGGAWSPLGDVTTTMLWIGGQITPVNIMKGLILPSLVCVAVPVLFVCRKIKGDLDAPEKVDGGSTISAFDRNLVLFMGLGIMLFVPVFKTVTHLPPFMAMLFGLGVLWVVTEVVHKQKSAEEKGGLTVANALRRIDTPSILFFLGILVAISALQSTGQLAMAADWLFRTFKSDAVVAMLMGLLSAVVDNVPLVAASQGMFSLEQYPTDHFFWEFLAYSTGTGGSCLIIGSAAGVAAMGMERIGFFWYLKNVSLLALLGFLAGAGVYVLMAGHF